MGVTERDEKLHTDRKVSSVTEGAASHGRMVGPDILRCVAMMMVVVLHFLGKGELLGDVTAEHMGAVGTAAWVLEAFCIVAVNAYMLISGYFLSTASFKLSRLISLYLQVWLYSAVVGLSAAAFGWLPASEVDTHYFLSLIFPIYMKHYWFMTAYLILYLLLPFLSLAVRSMSKKQLKLSLAVLLLAFCVMKSVVPFRLEGDGQGYSCMWYVCVFLTAAYIRRFGVPFLEKKWRCVLLYVGSCLALFAEMLVLRQVYLRTGKLELILKVSYEYNHILPFLAAVGLLGFFLKVGGQAAVRERDGKMAVGRDGKDAGMHGGKTTVGRIAGVVGKLSPYVLGVYLLHENLGLRYGWPKIFGAEGIRTVPELLGRTALAVVCVFVTGVIIEWIRSGIIKAIHSLLLHWKGYRWLSDSVERVDGIFKKQQA